MTGASLLEQVQAALRAGGYRVGVHQTEVWKPCRSALRALDGCVLLTAEEAEKVRRELGGCRGAFEEIGGMEPEVRSVSDALALLSGQGTET